MPAAVERSPLQAALANADGEARSRSLPLALLVPQRRQSDSAARRRGKLLRTMLQFTGNVNDTIWLTISQILESTMKKQIGIAIIAFGMALAPISGAWAQTGEQVARVGPWPVPLRWEQDRRDITGAVRAGIPRNPKRCTIITMVSSLKSRNRK